MRGLPKEVALRLGHDQAPESDSDLVISPDRNMIKKVQSENCHTLQANPLKLTSGGSAPSSSCFEFVHERSYWSIFSTC